MDSGPRSEGPQFCPWCGSPLAFEAHEHEPRYAELARRQGVEAGALPERVRSLLAGESYVGACPGCRTVSHVIGHRAPDEERAPSS